MRTSISDLKARAREHRGVCLDKVYKGPREKYGWRCRHGHEWFTTWETVQKGSWCPRCANGGEDLSTLRELARARNGACLSETFTTMRARYAWRCAAGHTWSATASHVKAGTWCPRCAGNAPTPLEDVQRLAAERGGVCLSAHVRNQSSVVRLRCAKGHEWKTKLANLAHGHWCPDCAGTKRGSLARMRKVATERGGTVSGTYENAESCLTWTCANGHAWQARAVQVTAGSWCPTCAGKTRTIEEMRELARERGGVCLSTVYVKSRAALKWRCSAGHEFELSPRSAQEGRRCRVCRSVPFNTPKA